MSAQSPFTIIATAARRRIHRVRTQVQYGYPSWRPIFRPCALGIIGLAIAVVLWGFGYKLSLYYRHSAPSSRVPVAKLWIESRDASEAAASRLKAKSHYVSGSHAFSVPIQPLPRLSRAVACILPVCTRHVVYFDSLIPFRSPPPHRVFLA